MPQIGCSSQFQQRKLQRKKRTLGDRFYNNYPANNGNANKVTQVQEEEEERGKKWTTFEEGEKKRTEGWEDILGGCTGIRICQFFCVNDFYLHIKWFLGITFKLFVDEGS